MVEQQDSSIHATLTEEAVSKQTVHTWFEQYSLRWTTDILRQVNNLYHSYNVVD